MNCLRCGDPARSVIGLRGAIEADIHVCPPCRATLLWRAAHWRGTFKALLEAGVDRAEANRRVIRMMDAAANA